MKRSILILLLLVFCVQLADAQRLRKREPSFMEFKFGQLDPEDAATGNLFGAAFGQSIDDRLGWGVELNIYKSTFRKQTTVADFDTAGIQFRERTIELEFSTTIVPVFLMLNYELPLGGKRTDTFRFRASAGIGWEFIWNFENNFLEDVERRRFFNGLGWHLSGGMGIRISRMGVLFFDIVYNDAQVTRNRDRTEDGLPIFQVMDVTGFGFVVGINITTKSIF